MSRLPLPGPSTLAPGPPPPSAHAQPLHQQQQQQQQQQAIASSSGSLPADISLRDLLERWAGSDDTLRVVMVAKSEEDRLRQEVLRLEVRRQEMEILREAVRAGVPPHMIPLMFAGGAAASTTASTLTAASMQSAAASQLPPPPTQQQQQQQASTAMQIQQQQQTPARHTYEASAASPPHTAGPAYSIPPFRGPPPAASPRQASGFEAYAERNANPAYSQPRLGQGILSNESGSGSLPLAPLQRKTSPQESTGQGPASAAKESRDSRNDAGLFFHHWQPPANPDGSREDDARNQSPTPKKRRTAGGSGASSSALTGGTLVPVGGGSSSSSAAASRRSPTRGHMRHRSEASVMSNSSRYNDPWQVSGSDRPGGVPQSPLSSSYAQQQQQLRGPSRDQPFLPLQSSSRPPQSQPPASAGGPALTPTSASARDAEYHQQQHPGQVKRPSPTGSIGQARESRERERDRDEFGDRSITGSVRRDYETSSERDRDRDRDRDRSGRHRGLSNSTIAEEAD
ncbi:hypothetical protein PYCC9005_003233 [Savitreella phatthalungensis]